MKLVVGLGNPGRDYAGTRHNIGFEVIDALAAKLGWTTGPGEFDRVARTKFDGLTLDGMAPGGSGESEKLLLLEPTTFMNVSGRSVRAAMDFYQLAPSDVMIVLDDLSLPVGRIRLRPGGSSGGHNGLKDIERALGTSDYPRLRLGVDPPPQYMAGRDYVLGRFTEAQRKPVDAAIARSVSAILTWIEKGINAAMNAFNADEPDEKPDRKTDESKND